MGRKMFAMLLLLAPCGFISASEIGIPLERAVHGNSAKALELASRVPRRFHSVEEFLQSSFLQASDEIGYIGTTKSGEVVAWTSTVGKVRAAAALRATAAKGDTEIHFPSNPRPGDIITYSTELKVGDAIYRYTYEFTFMMNPQTGQMEWMLTEQKVKFVRWDKQQQQ